MTNREAFLKMLRDEMEEKLALIEKMDSKELATLPAESFIRVKLHANLCVFKINSTGRSIGTTSEVIDWLDSERTEREEEYWKNS